MRNVVDNQNGFRIGSLVVKQVFNGIVVKDLSKGSTNKVSNSVDLSLEFVQKINNFVLVFLDRFGSNARAFIVAGRGWKWKCMTDAKGIFDIKTKKLARYRQRVAFGSSLDNAQNDTRIKLNLFGNSWTGRKGRLSCRTVTE